jgi:hypothetical protein
VAHASIRPIQCSGEDNISQRQDREGGTQPGKHDSWLMKIFLDNLSNSGLAVRRYSEGGATSPAEDPLGDDMPQYLVAIHHPDNYDPYAEGEAMVRDIDVLNK